MSSLPPRVSWGRDKRPPEFFLYIFNTKSCILMHSLAPKMGTTRVVIKTLTKTHWGKWRLLGEAAEWGPKGRKSRPKAESGVGFMGRGQQAPPARGSGERCQLPSRVPGGALAAQRFFHYFQHCRMPLLTLCIIVDHQKMKNSQPIQSWVNCCAFGDVVWCFETKYSQSESGMWWSSLQGRGEVDVGNSTLGGIPQAVPD